MGDKKIIKYRYLRLSIQYLGFVESVTEELIKQGNEYSVSSNHPISENEFHERTKWVDYKIAEPLIFNLYHGIELLLKGFLKSEQNINNITSHKIDELFVTFSEQFKDYKILVEKLEKYVGRNVKIINPLRIFFEENNINISNYYEALKYPEDKKSQKIFSYSNLKGLGEDGIHFFSELKTDINVLIIETVKYGRSIGM